MSRRPPNKDASPPLNWFPKTRRGRGQRRRWCARSQATKALFKAKEKRHALPDPRDWPELLEAAHHFARAQRLRVAFRRWLEQGRHLKALRLSQRAQQSPRRNGRSIPKGVATLRTIPPSRCTVVSTDADEAVPLAASDATSTSAPFGSESRVAVSESFAVLPEPSVHPPPDPAHAPFEVEVMGGSKGTRACTVRGDMLIGHLRRIAVAAVFPGASVDDCFIIFDGKLVPCYECRTLAAFGITSRSILHVFV